MSPAAQTKKRQKELVDTIANIGTYRYGISDNTWKDVATTGGGTAFTYSPMTATSTTFSASSLLGNKV